MPELPEVETIRRGLEKYLIGHVIGKVIINLPKQFSGDPKDIEGTTVISVKRFGKGLVISLSNNFSLAIHIKMTGQLIYRKLENTNLGKVGILPNKYTHVVFVLEDHASLFYNDLRQFGWIKVVPSNTVNHLPFFKELGPEFLSISPNKSISQAMFIAILHSSRKPIKVLIMDQKKMSGLGNIYANDALYLSCIDPKRLSNSLSDKEAVDLYNGIITVLQKGIAEGGSSYENYVNALGESGNYQNHMLVYGKNGKLCPRCGDKIIKIMLAGRGTYVCPHCQK